MEKKAQEGLLSRYRALNLTEESKFITGVILPVDGGQCAKIG